MKKNYAKTENNNNNQITFFEDIKCEKKEKELELIKRQQMLNSLHKPRKQINPKIFSDITKSRSSKKNRYFFSKYKFIKKL